MGASKLEGEKCRIGGHFSAVISNTGKMGLERSWKGSWKLWVASDNAFSA